MISRTPGEMSDENRKPAMVLIDLPEALSFSELCHATLTAI
jgi:hypothetical protein